MKIVGILILILFRVVALFSPLGAYRNEQSNTQEGTFYFPLSLLIIEDEAFAYTSPQTLVLPYGFQYIGVQAFSGISFLSDIYVPETTQRIADSAFSITSNLTIHGVNRSLAEDWANEHGVLFVVDNVWNTVVRNWRHSTTQFISINRFFTEIVLVSVFAFLGAGFYEDRSRRPQDRPELNPINYRFP